MDFRCHRPQAVKPREFEVGKRPRDEETEALIQQAFEEQEHEKLRIKGPPVNQGQPPKRPSIGKTLAEIEDEEGGPVRESMVGMASTKRALSRKDQTTQQPDAETEFGDVHEVQGAEEELEVEQEEGITFEPFNLRQEREEGFFDEEGNYVQNKDDARDAWLDSEEAAVVSEAARKRLAAQQAALAAADAAKKELSEGEIARMKLEMVDMMELGETVTKALKRIGGQQQSRKVLTKRERQKAEQQRQARALKAEGGEPVADKDKSQFLRLTELADTLLSSGELDIYSLRRELLESEAALYRPKAAVTATNSDDDDDDMFGDDEEMPDAKGQAGTSGNGAPAASTTPAPGATPSLNEPESQKGGTADAGPASNLGLSRAPSSKGEGSAAAPPPPAPSSGLLSEPEPSVDYATWPVKELRRFLQERGVDSSDIVEKAELAKRVRELAEEGPEGEMAPAPPGYVFDPGSGYFYSAETGLHYDASSGGFYQSSTSKWFSWDNATQQFVEWSTPSSG